MAPGSRRVYFLGAGASKQDGYPVTRELGYGIAWAIQREPERFEPLHRHLAYLYRIDRDTLERGATAWETLKNDRTLPGTDGTIQAPDVTDLLSTLDWMIREQSSFGPGVESTSTASGSLVTTLAVVRDFVVQALCYCLGTYRDLGSASTTRRLMDLVAPGDSLITTNWDLLIDAARDAKFGSSDGDYGTAGNVVLEGHQPARADARPKLLKLHGSLSWRYCQRCQRLVINPVNHVAGERRFRAQCDCTCRYSELIVTPGFVREYRNVHLLNIWREALLALAEADEWVFVGYSLPLDDVGIRALLMKARCIREDVSGRPPRVLVVSGRGDRQVTLGRYRSILHTADVYPGDFGEFVQAPDIRAAFVTQ